MKPNPPKNNFVNFLLSVFLLTNSSVLGKFLQAKEAEASLPFRYVKSSAAIYDDQDSVYIFGG